MSCPHGRSTGFLCRPCQRELETSYRAPRSTPQNTQRTLDFDPVKVRARFDSSCHDCGGRIAEGDMIWKLPGEQGFGHVECSD